MALPIITPEQRQAALAKAAAVRSERSAVKASLRAGTLSLGDLLARAEKGDPIVTGLRVREVIMAMPGMGKVRTAAIMDSLGVAPNRRIAGLGQRQRADLLEALEG